MSWFKGIYPSLSEMRLEKKRYLQMAYKVKKNIPHTLAQLRNLRKKSRLAPNVDVWPELDKDIKVNALVTIKGSEIKSAFRRYLMQNQENRCCYCRRWLSNIAHAKPIEHILPRSHFPQFSIQFWNLAVACSDCNTIKSDDVWGSTSLHSSRYPVPHEFTDIFHPRFHRYNDHIRYIRLETNLSAVVIFTGCTPQGQHLCRSLLHKIARKETFIQNNQILATAIKHIDSFKEKAETLNLNLQHFDAFSKTLNESILRLLETT